MTPGFSEILLILVVILLLFGGKRIPELAKALGKAKYEYTKAKELLKKETESITDAVDNAAKEAQEKEEAKENT